MFVWPCSSTTRFRSYRAVSESATSPWTPRQSLEGQGEGCDRFRAGEPDFPTPAHIVEQPRGVREPRNHHYTPARPAELREPLHENGRDSQFDVTAAQVLVTNGGKQAVEEAFASLLDRGTRCCSQRPIGHLPEVVRLAAGARRGPNHAGSGYKVTVEQLERVSRPGPSAFVCLALQPDGPSMARTRCVPWPLGRTSAGCGGDREIYEHLVYGSARFTRCPCWCRN